ncbi:MAG: hypothetical protein MN733_15530 [Nitrososphaera sp.]|nr:hypothetical protein [Nitrososphaera sp.]
MRRYAAQDEGLRKYYERRKKQTRQEFLDAMDSLLRGQPILTDGKLTEANLCREACRSRATLGRYPDIRKAFATAKKQRRKGAPKDLYQKVKETEEAKQQVKKALNAEIRELSRERDVLAQQVYLLERVIERLVRGRSDRVAQTIKDVLPFKIRKNGKTK